MAIDWEAEKRANLKQELVKLWEQFEEAEIVHPRLGPFTTKATELETGDIFTIRDEGGSTRQVTVVACRGSSELDSDANDGHYMVFQVAGDERLFMVTGEWISHNGMYWDDELKVVQRELQTVTDYVWVDG